MSTVQQRSPEISGFGEWRATRPFWGGVFLILASLVIGWVPLQFAVELLFIGGAFTVIGLVFAVLVFLTGAFALYRPDLSTILGVTGIAFSILSVIGALGGLLVGTLLGLVGGSLCVAWEPPETSERRSPTGTTAGGAGGADEGRRFRWQQDPYAEETEPAGAADADEAEQFQWQRDPHAEETEPAGAAESSRSEWQEERAESDASAEEESTPPPGEHEAEGDDEDNPFAWQEDPYAEESDEN